MLEQKFNFLVKDLSLNYHLGKEKCKKALKLYGIWLFKVGGVFPILPKLPWPKVSFSYTVCGGSCTNHDVPIILIYYVNVISDITLEDAPAEIRCSW